MKKLLTLAVLAAALQVANAQTAPATKATPATPATKATPATTATRPAPTAATAVKPEAAPTDAPAVKPGEEPVFKWSEETWDFGTIPQGTPVTHEFKFTNTGKSPLVISKVDKSCGCTTPKWSTEPVMPGKTGWVSATFNAAAANAFTKTVTVHSNAKDGDKVLFIKGVVKAKDAPAEGAATPAPATAPASTTPH